jgi:hypothetical protein
VRSQALGFGREHACLLRVDLQKRVQQTQREAIRDFDAVGACLRGSGPCAAQRACSPDPRDAALLRPDFRPGDSPLPAAAAACATEASAKLRAAWAPHLTTELDQDAVPGFYAVGPTGINKKGAKGKGRGGKAKGRGAKGKGRGGKAKGH